MKTTKKLTVSAMAVALGTVFMVVGAVFEVMDMTASALASLLVAIIYVEVGSPYTFLVWIATTLTTALLYPGSAMWIMYLLLFGIYPIVKGYIERLPRTLWLILKLLFGNLMMALIFLGCSFILGIPLDMELFGLPTGAVYAIFAVLVNLALILYDLFLTVLIRFYMVKLHPVLRKVLK